MDKTIGIFGGGQLGRMMAQAALPLNIQCTFFEASTDCPSAALGPVISSQAEMVCKTLLTVQMYLALSLKIRHLQMLMY